MKNKLLSTITALWFTLGAFAAQITGVVMAEGEPDPVIGANIMVKGTTVGTITDFDGNFVIEANVGEVLVISYMGYKTQEVKAIAAPMRITLIPDNVMLEEVVAIGYGTMKKSDLTGALSAVNADDIKKSAATRLDQALQGKAAGVTVNSNSGQPGEAATIRIRGIGSAIGGSDPIYVVDGVITDNISFLAPSDIMSTEILKDASATAIYGSRGANGVILVTTRQGSKGKANISFDASWGLQNRWRKLDLMGSQEHALTELKLVSVKDPVSSGIATYLQSGFNQWLSLYKLGGSDYFPVAKTALTPNGFDYSAVNTDWQDEVFKANALTHNYSLSIDGAGDKYNYAISASYYNQDGTIIGSNYERLTIRANSSFQATNWLKIGEHISFASIRGRYAMNNSASAGASIISAALAMAPWDPTHYSAGYLTPTGRDLGGQISAGTNAKEVTNPFSMVENTHPQNNNERLVGDIYMEIVPVKGLTFRPSISYDLTINRDRTFKDQYTYSKYDAMTKNFISSSMSRISTLTEEATLTYANTIDKHNFSVMAGQTIEEYNYYILTASGSAITNPVPTNWYVNNATEDLNANGSDGVARVRRASFIARGYYNYDDRYMATLTFRADGSSKFPQNTWGFFPSVALAWRISQEPFMRDLDYIDQLKLRAGWGQVGNDGVGDNAFTMAMGSSNNWFYAYPFGNPQALQTGATILTYVNLNGKWETNEQWNVGLDFGFWNGKLSGNIDAFIRDTKDALLYVNAPSYTGNQFPLTKNVGNIRNSGIEIALDHHNRAGEFSYNIGANISFIKNQVTALNGGSPLYGDRTKTDVGLALNTLWGYKYLGIFQSDAEALAAFPNSTGLHAGDARYEDYNNDGKLDENDMQVIGNPFPWLTYGVNFGADFYGVDIQVFFQGVYGNQIYNALRERIEGTGEASTLSTSMRNVWVGYSSTVQMSLLEQGVDYRKLENRDGTIPNPNGASTNMSNNSRMVESGAYLRLKNLVIGYTIPQKYTRKAKIERIRVSFSAANLFTITGYTGYDPEVGSGVDYGNYPQSRSYAFGLNLNF